MPTVSVSNFMGFGNYPLATGLGRSGPEILFYGIGIALLVGLAFLAPHRGLRCVRSFERAIAMLSRHRPRPGTSSASTYACSITKARVRAPSGIEACARRST